MNAGNVFSYIGLALVAGAAVFLSFRLFLRYSRRFLLYYALSLVFSYAFGLVDIVGYLTAAELLGRQAAPASAHATVSFVFHVLAFPALVLGWFFFLRALAEIRAMKVPRWATAAYFTVQAALLTGYAATGGAGLARLPLQKTYAATSFLFAMNLGTRLLIFAMLLSVAFAWRPAGDEAERERARGLKRFAAIYAAAYLGYGITALLTQDRGFVCYTYPIAEFVMHLPPLAFLAVFLRAYYREHRLSSSPRATLDLFFDRHGLTDREREVASLLLQGRSGRDIAAGLFVSLKTVKTHVTNIYRKAGVKGRWQLIAAAENAGRGIAADVRPGAGVESPGATVVH